MRAGQRPAGAAVRRSQMERRLDEHVDELGQRMSAWAVRFYKDVVLPLEQRVAWLELPWYRRLWYRLAAWWLVRVRGRSADRPDDFEASEVRNDS